MAGGALKYRHLSRKSSHRQALLRNLVTSLFEHESISTTWPKAKEAQRLADKIVTLGKRNTQAARNRVQGSFTYAPELGAERSRSFIDSQPETFRTHAQTLQRTSDSVSKQTWRLHSSPANRTLEGRSGAFGDIGAGRWTQRHAIRHDGKDS